MQLPQAFQDKMKNLLGPSYDAYLASYDEPKYQGLRIHTLKLTPVAWSAPCPFAV